jgi:tetratricopeptide (TPR) repeat protein
MKMKSESRREFFGNLRWLCEECLKVFTAPMGVIAGVLDAARGWRYSRNWLRFWFNVPALLAILAVYLAFGFSLFERVDSMVQRYSVEGERNCPTRLLERSAYSQFDFVNRAMGRQSDQNDISEVQLRYAELLSKRIESIQPTNAPARYRLALVNSLKEGVEAAFPVMDDLAEGKYGTFRPANAWMATYIIQQQEQKKEINLKKLAEHLKLASEWPDANVLLLSYYSRLLEANGQNANAISIAKEAAKRRPELNLELAMLYDRLKLEDGIREAGYLVEEEFQKRLNTSGERDFDRIAIAKVRAMMGKYPQAIAVLQEGLANNAQRPQLAKVLSEVRIDMFKNSIRELDEGKFTADFSQLEAAIDADPTNPQISEQAAELLSRNIPVNSKKVVDALRKQIDQGLTTAKIHNTLAVSHYQRQNTAEAVKNWRIAIEKDVNDATAYNNLALCLAKAATSDAEMKEPLGLIQQANALSPSNAEILDTYGEILLLAKRPKEAINKFELAIGIDRNRIDTRKKIVVAYKLLGMKELATAQQEVIDSMTSKTDSNSKN